ncbi:MAG: dTDP-glucose pyrophosphorylase, partial [Halorientalis sp.]
PPVDLGEDVAVSASVVGPHVSVDDGATIAESIVRDSIVGRNATLEGVNLAGSIVGDNASVSGEPNHLNVGDNSSIDL